MSGLSSKLKTWLRRNGFSGEGDKGNRQPLRECNGYVVKAGRRYRFRELDGVVDIGSKVQDFDRWANSTERTVPISEFIAAKKEQP